MTGYDSLYAALQAEGIYALPHRVLADCSSFRIGGPCALAIYPTDAASLMSACALVREAGLPLLTVGKGSNLLFPDEGLEAAVLFTERMNGITYGDGYVTAQAGASFRHLCHDAGCERGFDGFVFGCGIPGSVGGAVFMNAGAYGGEVADLLLQSTYYDRESGSFGTLSAAEHAFAYRDSFYRAHPSLILLEARFACRAGNREQNIAKCRENMRARREKQPLEHPSAGSTFKRPEGFFAGKLIEEAGLKGYRIGDAQVSEKHAGFVINRGNATAADVRCLIAYVQKRVFETFGVRLEREVIYPEDL